MFAGLLAVGAAEGVLVAMSEGVGTGTVAVVTEGALWKSSKSSTEITIRHARRKVQQDSQSFDVAGLDVVAVGATTAGAGAGAEAEVEGPQESSSKSSRF